MAFDGIALKTAFTIPGTCTLDDCMIITKYIAALYIIMKTYDCVSLPRKREQEQLDGSK
jgi:hypothetical protein